MPRNRVLSHLSYVVSDIEKAVHDWARTTGAGPFFLIENIRFDQVSHRGEPCVFDHSAAFGQFGAIAIELQQISSSSPATLTERLVPGPLPVINHVAYISAEPEREIEELSQAGFEQFLHATFGDVEVWMHDARHALGHDIEIHRKTGFIDTFFSDIAAAASGWDGRDPLRSLS